MDLARAGLVSFDQIDAAPILVSEKKALFAVLSVVRKERIRTKRIMRALLPKVEPTRLAKESTIFFTTKNEM